MKKFNMVATSLTLVVATMLVAGTLLFPYNYAKAMAITGNGVEPHPHPHPHPHPQHTAVNTTRSNVKSSR